METAFTKLDWQFSDWKLQSSEALTINSKKKEEALKNAAASLESDLASLEDAVRLIRVASEGLTLVTRTSLRLQFQVTVSFANGTLAQSWLVIICSIGKQVTPIR